MMKFAQRAVAGLCTATLLFTATACGGKGVNVGGGGHSGGTLVASLIAEPEAFDPNNTTAYPTLQIMENIFDTLVQPDDNNHPAPALATGWQVSSDELTWTFNLRTTKWHDGTPFTSADVVYTFDRMLNGKLAWSAQFATVKSVTAEGPRKVVLELKRPTPHLLTLIGGFKGMAIVQQKNVESGAIKNHPIGTGPFKFASWARGSAVNLAANPAYWGGKPRLAGLKFTFVSDPTVALQNLRSGEVQWTDNLPPQQVESLQKSTNNGFVVQAPVAFGDYSYVLLNEHNRPFDDKRARQAVAYAIDRAAITKATRFGTGVVSQTAIPKGNPWYYDYAPYTHDLAKAKALLSAAGVGGKTLDYLATSASPEGVTAGQIMASELAPLGFKLKIRTVDVPHFLQDLGSGKYDITYSAWVGRLDPSDFYYQQHYSKGIFNRQGYHNPDVDKLLDEAGVTTDMARRKVLYDEAAKHIIDDASYIYVCNWRVVQGFSGKVHGYTARPDRAIRFLHTYLS